MHCWIAQLVCKALSEYLQSEGSDHHTPSPAQFQYSEGLSNLSISVDPRLLRTVQLLKFRHQKEDIKGVVGDGEHSIRTTFTKAALSAPAATVDGIPLTQIPVGAHLRIFDCQIRVTDCFNPPRVELRITSFGVIARRDISQHIERWKRVEKNDLVLNKLIEYNLRRSGMDNDNENQEPLLSQEAFLTQVPSQSLRPPTPQRPRAKVSASIISKQPLHKLSETAGNAQIRHLQKNIAGTFDEISRHPELKGTRPAQMSRDTSELVPSTSSLITQVPIHSNSSSGLDSPRRASISKSGMHSSLSRPTAHACKRTTKFRDDPRLSALAREVLGSTDSSPAVCEPLLQMPEADTEQFVAVRNIIQENPGVTRRLWTLEDELSEALHDPSHLAGKASGSTAAGQNVLKRSVTRQPSWRWKKASAKIIPRYVNTITKDQQELLEDKFAHWQPSVIGQLSIEGQVPMRLFERINRTADELTKAKTQALCIEGDRDVDTGDDDVSAPAEVPQLDLVPDQNSSPAASSKLSWSQSNHGSPEGPAQIRPRLPPDSSPFKSATNSPGEQIPYHGASTRQGTPLSLARPNGELGSSPFSEPVDSGDEGSPPRIPADDDASEQKAASDTNFNTVQAKVLSESPQRPHEVELGRHERELDITDHRRLLNSSNNPALAGIASSLDSLREVQVTQTPTAQRSDSDAMSTWDKDRNKQHSIDYEHHTGPQNSVAESLPPSSFCIPGTTFPRPQREAITTAIPIQPTNVPGAMLASEPEPPRAEKDLRVEQAVRPVEGAETVEMNRKRKQDIETSEVRSKRPKNDISRSRPIIVTSRDPEWAEWELKRRRIRREEVDRQKREEEIAREEQRWTATALENDKSVESKERPLSPRSSVLSLAKHRVSTPITRSSDYQLPENDKNRQQSYASVELSVNEAGDQDVFHIFKRTYPTYSGGCKQFDKACHLIRRSGDEAPQVYEWDDFVFRYNNEYLDYQEKRIGAGKLPLVYYQYYRDFVDEPLCNGKIITRAHIQGLSDGSSLRESTPSGSNQLFQPPRLLGRNPIGVANSIDKTEAQEPQLPPPPPRFEEKAITKPAASQTKLPSPPINQLQHSSVEQWLETVPAKSKPIRKEPGASSPELGAPINEEETEDVPTLDLKGPASSSAPAVKSTKRSLPWKSPHDPPSLSARTNTGSVSAQKPSFDKGTQKAGRRHTEVPLRRQEQFIDITKPAVFHKPRPNAQTPLRQLKKHFASLDRGRGIRSASAGNDIDIFGWRK